jgi:adenine-specific DNA-methyltransferase
MLDFIISQTTAFLSAMPKSKRKKIGQFFTSRETAEYMASMFDFSRAQGEVWVLDPGAGTGVLTAAIVDRLQGIETVRAINITCYETDPEVLPLLKNNLRYIEERAIVPLNYSVIEEDYLLSQADDFNGVSRESESAPKYDFVIGNPPYLRVNKDHAAAVSLSEVVHGAPNLYFLFASMSLFNLRGGGEMVYIIPRSWTSGAYFKAFRTYFLHYGKLTHIHLFVSRDKVFSQEQVLQETIILKAKKTAEIPKKVLLTSSHSNSDFNSITKIELPYDSIVAGKDLYVFLPTSREDVRAIQSMNRYTNTLPDIGFRMKTGIIVDFRNRDLLRGEPGEHVLPLFYSQHIKDGRVFHLPSGKDFDWVVDSKPGLIQKNKNYVFCKRFTAKEERRRLQCGIYLESDFSEYDSIGTQNKINFVDHTNGEPLSLSEVYGLYALFNSSLFDRYYRILNGSTQVNSTEVNNIPVPPVDVICDIGERLITANDLSTETCDKILNEVAYG